MIDTGRKHEIRELVDVDLQKDEDSVTSLGVVTSTEDSAVAYVGINSSTADQNAGKNEHLRSFRLRYPRRSKFSEKDDAQNKAKVDHSRSTGTEALGRIAFFSPDPRPKKESYQRVLRLLQPTEDRGGSRLAAIASGLAPEGEVVVFNASASLPSWKDIRCRFNLGEGSEAGDVDICTAPLNSHYVAFCTDYEVQLARLDPQNTTQDPKPACVYAVPHPDAFASTSSRPKLRSLRFLTPHLMLILQNYPNRTGAELLLLELSSSASVEGNIILRRRLRKSVKSATVLTTCTLPSRSSTGPSQSVIAVAGQDNSITILTLDHPSTSPFGSLKFRQYAFLSDVHANLLTSLTFSQPARLPDDIMKAPVQYIKLASTSVANTVVVYTLPLSPYPALGTRKAFERFVLAVPGHDEAWQMTFSVIISAIVIAIGAFLLQAFTEIRGGTPEYLGAKGWLPRKVHGWIARPYMFDEASSVASTASTTIVLVSDSASKVIEDAVNSAIGPAKSVTSQASESISSIAHVAESSAQSATQNIAFLLHLHHQSRATATASPDISSQQQQGILISHDPDSDSVHAAQYDTQQLTEEDEYKARRWEQLSEQEREKWKKILVDAGHVAESQAEAVLKGVFFGSIAQAVGAAVG